MTEPGPTEPAVAPRLNTVQRWYFRWVTPHRARMVPSVRAQAEAMDRLLCSRRGIGVWLGLAAGVGGTAIGLHVVGVPWGVAIPVAVVLVFGLVSMVASAWLMPERFSGRKLLRVAFVMMAGTYAGTLATVIAQGHAAGSTAQHWLETAGAVIWRATPFQLIAGLAFMLVMWVTITARRARPRRRSCACSMRCVGATTSCRCRAISRGSFAASDAPPNCGPTAAAILPP